MSSEDLQAIAEKSNSVLRDLTRKGNTVQWIESFVTDEGITCVYVASDPEIVREHARCGGFPADRITEVRNMINPITGDRVLSSASSVI